MEEIECSPENIVVLRLSVNITFFMVIALSADMLKCRDALYRCNECSSPFFAW